MAKILVLYHSMYGHIETMANAVAEGARRVPGVEVTIKRVPETMPEDAFRNAGDNIYSTPLTWNTELVTLALASPTYSDRFPLTTLPGP